MDYQSSTLDLLRGTRREIAERGWCRFRVMDDSGRVCVRGGMLAACGASFYLPAWTLECGWQEADRRMALALGFLDGEGMVHWNNWQASNREEVLAHLDAAIARLELEELAALPETAEPDVVADLVLV